MKLSIVHQNVQCISNKIGELELFLEDGCDVFCVSEHWSGLRDIESVGLTGFCLVDHYSRQMHKHGGVAIFVRNNITEMSSGIEAVRDISVDFHFECVVSRIHLPGVKLLVAAIYRSDKGNFSIFLDKLNETLDILQKYNGHRIVLCGDFNVNFLAPSGDLRALCDLLATYDIKITIKEPTRKQNCLDNICVSSGFLESSSTVIHNGMSDHSAQSFQFLTESHDVLLGNNRVAYRQLKNIKNIQYFNELLSRETWEDVTCLSDVDQQYERFAEMVGHDFELAFPLKYKNAKTVKPSNAWITKGIRISSQRVKALYRLTLTGNLDDINYYRKYKNIYRKVIARAKLMYNSDLMSGSSNKTKTAWSIIRDSTTSKQKTGRRIAVRVNDETVGDPIRIAEYFNNYFNTVTDSMLLPTCEIVPHNVKHCPNSFFFEPLCERDVRNIINQIRDTSSYGEDQISMYLLKRCVDAVVMPLTRIINDSVTQGKFPDALKVSKIIPILKHGPRDSLESYRPISLLNSFSKIFEKIMATRILKFLEKNNILSDQQFGFRKGRDTSTAITAFLDFLYKDIDAGKSCFGVFLDLSKAFDLVNHSLLTDKLYCYGIRGNVLNWMRSYLCGRMHYTNVGDACSGRLQSKRGVPQGSVLGPLLYIIYVNDFAIKRSVLYADDTSMMVSSVSRSNAIEEMKESLNKVENYTLRNDLLVNCKKTAFIEFKPSTYERDRSSLIRYRNTSIGQVDSVKFLGLTVDYRCNWKEHIDYLCGRLAPMCHAIRRLRAVVTSNVLLTFYFGQFHSLMTYVTIAWGASPDFDRVFGMQKRAIRAMNGIGHRASCRELFVSMNILPLPCVYIMQLLVYANNNLNSIRKVNDYHSYNTRNGLVLEIPKHRLSFYERSPHFLAIKTYNKLPDSFKMQTESHFKRSVKQFLIGKCYYSLAEFFDDSL